ncbi:unnamed protein product [Amoebophrya sp. A120]|nr:unnamed protein product [Amoebophrya sp. A120]|eukprot:GSA120T00022699001.1
MLRAALIRAPALQALAVLGIMLPSAQRSAKQSATRTLDVSTHSSESHQIQTSERDGIAKQDQRPRNARLEIPSVATSSSSLRPLNTGLQARPIQRRQSFLKIGGERSRRKTSLPSAPEDAAPAKRRTTRRAIPKSKLARVFLEKKKEACLPTMGNVAKIAQKGALRKAVPAESRQAQEFEAPRNEQQAAWKAAQEEQQAALAEANKLPPPSNSPPGGGSGAEEQNLLAASGSEQLGRGQLGSAVDVDSMTPNPVDCKRIAPNWNPTAEELARTPNRFNVILIPFGWPGTGVGRANSDDDASSEGGPPEPPRPFPPRPPSSTQGEQLPGTRASRQTVKESEPRDASATTTLQTREQPAGGSVAAFRSHGEQDATSFHRHGETDAGGAGQHRGTGGSALTVEEGNDEEARTGSARTGSSWNAGDVERADAGLHERSSAGAKMFLPAATSTRDSTAPDLPPAPPAAPPAPQEDETGLRAWRDYTSEMVGRMEELFPPFSSLGNEFFNVWRVNHWPRKSEYHSVRSTDCYHTATLPNALKAVGAADGFPVKCTDWEPLARHAYELCRGDLPTMKHITFSVQVYMTYDDLVVLNGKQYGWGEWGRNMMIMSARTSETASFRAALLAHELSHAMFGITDEYDTFIDRRILAKSPNCGWEHDPTKFDEFTKASVGAGDSFEASNGVTSAAAPASKSNTTSAEFVAVQKTGLEGGSAKDSSARAGDDENAPGNNISPGAFSGEGDEQASSTNLAKVDEQDEAAASFTEHMESGSELRCCWKWQDLVRNGLAECVRGGCTQKQYCTGLSTEKSLMAGPRETDRMSHVHKRVTCCKYRAMLGYVPQFCSHYTNKNDFPAPQYPLDLDAFCDDTNRWKALGLDMDPAHPLVPEASPIQDVHTDEELAGGSAGNMKISVARRLGQETVQMPLEATLARWIRLRRQMSQRRREMLRRMAARPQTRNVNRAHVR